jgi:uncharacterized membrane protein
VFAACWTALDHWFGYGSQLVDTPTYERYGEAIRAGLVPYRDVAIEYPPGALPVFVLPTFFTWYGVAFERLMGACGALCVLLATLAGAPARSLAFLAVSPLAIGVLALSRFDFYAALFLSAAVTALLRDRHRLGFAALGGAVAVKLFGAVLVPLAAVWTLRRRGRRELALAAACGGAVVVAAAAPFLVLAPSGLWHSLEGEASRPLQIESLAAAFLTTFGQPTVVSSHGSQNLAGQGALAAATSAVAAAVLVALWVGFARGRASEERLVRYAAASVGAFVAFGKVLSPQFLIWLLPLVALVRGRRGAAATALLAAALVLTQVEFPERYWSYVDGFHLAWLVLLRDLVLVALVAVLSLRPPARGRARSA